MAHIRVLRHYIHTPFLLAASLEAMSLFVAAYFGYTTRYGALPDVVSHLPYALSFAIIHTACMAMMGVYEARLREGYLASLLRTAVAMFLLGTLGMAVVLYFVPTIFEGRGVLLFATIEGFVLVVIVRWLTSRLLNEDFLKKRVAIIGTGFRAARVAGRMRRRSDRRAFVLLGFLQEPGGKEKVSSFGAKVYPFPEGDLLNFCRENQVSELVVSTDNDSGHSEQGFPPFRELMECRLSGVDICEVQDFVERESGKIDVDLLQRSWLVFTDGFTTSEVRGLTKRTFDLITAGFLLILFAPVMAAASLCIGIGSGFRSPILYRQERVGLDGKLFQVIKFRTMRVDAEDDGAMWADHNDPRVTRIGRFLRRTHLDELPQLLNVISGEMSMVGPRPERTVFVDELIAQLPYYEQRHRLKPGVTGWAQLCYPYGASVEDSKEKLQYDLYYLKNHSILLDLIILLQTVEVVLVGEGAR